MQHFLLIIFITSNKTSPKGFPEIEQNNFFFGASKLYNRSTLLLDTEWKALNEVKMYCCAWDSWRELTIGSERLEWVRSKKPVFSFLGYAQFFRFAESNMSLCLMHFDDHNLLVTHFRVCIKMYFNVSKVLHCFSKKKHKRAIEKSCKYFRFATFSAAALQG